MNSSLDAPAPLVLEAVLLTGLLVSWLVGRPLREPNALADLSAGLSGIFAMGGQSALVQLPVRDSVHQCDDYEYHSADDRHNRVRAGRYESCRRVRGSKRRRLWPVMLGFLLGTLADAVAYVRLDLWCMCSPLIVGALSVWAIAFSVRKHAPYLRLKSQYTGVARIRTIRSARLANIQTLASRSRIRSVQDRSPVRA
jgi:hypothetical protein